MRTNAATFRRYAFIEEQMMRAAMPRVSANDPTPMRYATVRVPAVVKPLTVTMREAVNG